MFKKLVIISAPSGAGKTSIVKKFLETHSDTWQQVMTCTTRHPRDTETDRVDYCFLDTAAFKYLIQSGDFLEYTEVHGNLYGTLLSDLESVWDQNKNAILIIDVQGKKTIETKIHGLTSIFITAPDLESRIKNRGSDSEKEIQTRLFTAKREIEQKDTYDHLIVNDNFDVAVQDLESILCQNT